MPSAVLDPLYLTESYPSSWHPVTSGRINVPGETDGFRGEVPSQQGSLQGRCRRCGGHPNDSTGPPVTPSLLTRSQRQGCLGDLAIPDTHNHFWVKTNKNKKQLKVSGENTQLPSLFFLGNFFSWLRRRVENCGAPSGCGLEQSAEAEQPPKNQLPCPFKSWGRAQPWGWIRAWPF